MRVSTGWSNCPPHRLPLIDPSKINELRTYDPAKDWPTAAAESVGAKDAAAFKVFVNETLARVYAVMGLQPDGLQNSPPADQQLRVDVLSLLHREPANQAELEEKRMILFNQIKEMRAQGSWEIRITCPCCKKSIGLHFMYKCLYCGIYFCRVCAAVHFEHPHKNNNQSPTTEACVHCIHCKYYMFVGAAKENGGTKSKCEVYTDSAMNALKQALYDCAADWCHSNPAEKYLCDVDPDRFDVYLYLEKTPRTSLIAELVEKLRENGFDIIIKKAGV